MPDLRIEKTEEDREYSRLHSHVQSARPEKAKRNSNRDSRRRHHHPHH